jgi:hypothetical protein
MKNVPILSKITRATIHMALVGSAVMWLTPLGLADIITVVGASQGPWIQGLNPTFDYGSGGNPPDNTAPDILTAGDGLSFAPGSAITLTYLSGLVSADASDPSGYPFVDANGEITNPAADFGGNTQPSFYVGPDYPGYLAELMGTFADDGVIVGSPFLLGDGPTTIIVPAGANQLLLGVNDGSYSDNGGSLTVDVSQGAPEPSSFVLGFTTVGLALAFALLRRGTSPTSGSKRAV